MPPASPTKENEPPSTSSSPSRPEETDAYWEARFASLEPDEQALLDGLAALDKAEAAQRHPKGLSPSFSISVRPSARSAAHSPPAVLLALASRLGVGCLA